MSIDALKRARAAASRLKVFPLPPVVLLPGGVLPLHVFELRYRELVKDAMASDQLLAMAQVLPGQEKMLSGKPQLDEMLCVGSISLHEPLDDGRCNILLAGVARARVLRELPQTRLYREVAAELLPDQPADGVEDDRLQQAVLELITRLPVSVGQRVAQLTFQARGGQLADVIASTIHQDAARRYEVLSELDVAERIRSVTDDVLMLAGRIKPLKPEGLLN